MAVTTYTLDGKPSTMRFTGTVDERTFEQQYIASSDNNTVDSTPRDVVLGCQALTLPKMGDVHADDPKMTVTSIVCERLPDQTENPAPGDMTYFRITVRWSTKGDAKQEDDEGGFSDPTQVPLQVSIGFQRRSEPAHRAYWRSDLLPAEVPPIADNQLIRTVANSAGQTFDPPLEEDQYDSTVTVVKNESLSDLNAHVRVRRLTGTINNAVFWGYGPKKVLLEVTAEKQYDTGAYYYRMTYRFIIRPTNSGWDRELVNAGTHVLNQDGTFEVAKDWLGLPVADPVQLQTDGQLPPTQLADQLETVTFRTRYAEDWASFLPSDIDTLLDP